MSSRATILIVDDSLAGRQTLQELLIAQEYDLAFANDGPEALAKAAELTPDLILLDVMMPGMDGFEVCRRLRADSRLAEVPVIMVTALEDRDARLHGLEAGADDFISKPFDRAELRARVRTVTRLNRYGRLLAERARFERLTELSPDGILIIDLEGTIRLANPAMRLILWADSREVVVGKNVSAFIAPEHLEYCLANLKRVSADTSQVLRFETVFVRLDGRRTCVEVNTGHLIWDDRPAAQVVVRDISERKQRERELQAIATVSAALRAAPTRSDMLPVILNQVLSLLKADGVALVTHSPARGGMVVALARGAWANWTGMPIVPGEGLGGHIVAHAIGRPYLNNDVTADLRLTGSALIDELRAVAGVPLIVQNQTIGVLGISRKAEITDGELNLLAAVGDIAANALQRAQMVETLEQRVAERTHELAEANDRLQELDQLKSKFVSEVSHELRTPVTNLKLHLELLERGKPEKRAQYMTTLKQQADQLAQLIEDILSLSRLELAATNVQFASVDLNALVGQVAVVHRPQADSTGLSLIVTTAPNLPRVLGERNQLAQVITNLLANAINYTPAGEVRVSTYQRDNQVCLEVRDTGIGIDPDDMPYIFERFYRGKNVSRSDIRGTGLGLGIVKEIVDLHYGTVDVESAVGVGSTFRVWLPAAESST